MIIIRSSTTLPKMTRFARAKGSKSSNERIPDEATPWNVMKMQLESSQAASTSFVKKAKNARELLAEKDEPFYSDTTGNVNHEWAEFDDVSKIESKRNGNVKKDKKKKKAAVVNGDSNNDKVPKGLTKNDDQDIVGETESYVIIDECKSKSKGNEKVVSNDPEIRMNVEKIIKGKNGQKRATDEGGNFEPKSKKRAKKSKKLKLSGTEDNNPSELDEKCLDVDESKTPVEPLAKENFEKLSKRQKRNQKKQRKIMSDSKNEASTKLTEENNRKKEENPKSFDVEGNDWSNEVKFGKQANPRPANRVNKNDDRVDGNEDRKKGIEKRNKSKNKDDSKVQSEDNELQNNESKQIPQDSNPSAENNADGKKNQKRKGGSKNDKKEYKRRKPDEGVINMIINGNEVLVVKYDGFPVKKEDADRLQELKKNMIIKGIPRSEINIAMKLERRKAEKALARERKRVCFHCRKSGHNLSDCPELGRDEAGTGICFKCGSAEHTHFECKVVKAQEFRHASCFICREQGHIARQCPDNPKGLYPQGGGCKICGDVTHLKKDCPDLIKEKEENNITADKITGDQLEALEGDNVVMKTGNDDNKTRSKIIKF